MSVAQASLAEILGEIDGSELKIAADFARMFAARGRLANRCRTSITAVRLAPRFPTLWRWAVGYDRTTTAALIRDAARSMTSGYFYSDDAALRAANVVARRTLEPMRQRRA
jgi:hypothetical protein